MYFFSSIVHAQVISGQVFNKDQEPLAFVNILINSDPSNGFTTDIDGNFNIDIAAYITFLEFRYVGYETLILNLNEVKALDLYQVTLQESTYELNEAVVIAGENPAHRIIKKVVAQRKNNQPRFFDQYSCETYNKLVFDFLPNEEAYQDHIRKIAISGNSNRVQRRLDTVSLRYINFAQREQHLMIAETVTEKLYQAPNNHKETVTMNRVSGFKNPNFVALAKDAQPFSFYDPNLNILEKTYVNPISKGSTKAYYFEIIDTLYQQQDSIYIIQFQPKKGKKFNALEGTLYINTNQYALQNVLAAPADKGMTELKIEQKYTFYSAAKKWFPEQLNFEWIMPKYPSKYVGMKITGKSYLSKVDFNPIIDKKDFTADKYILQNGCTEISDSIWAQHRHESLDQSDQNTFIWWDTLKAARRMETMIHISESLVSGVLPVGKINIDIPRIYDANQYEQHRFGIGLHTNHKFLKWMELGGYAGYGTADKAWKYGGRVRFFLPSKREMFLGLGYHFDTRVPGIPQFPKNDYSPVLFDSGLYAFRMDDFEEYYVKVGATFFKNAQFHLTYSENSWRPNYDYLFNRADQLPSRFFEFSEIKLGLRYAYGEQFIPFMGKRIANSTRFPVIQIQATKGLNIFSSDNYSYEQYILAVEHQFPIKRWGEMSYRVEAGTSSTLLPYAKLFNQSGIGIEFRMLDLDNVFQTMGQFEFLSDRYVSLFWEHDFGALWKKYKWSRPGLSISHNMGFGQLRSPEVHQEIEFKTLEKGFFESGIALDNIVRFNYINFAYLGIGFAAYVRYGHYAFEEFGDNIAYRLTVDFDF